MRAWARMLTQGLGWFSAERGNRGEWMRCPRLSLSPSRRDTRRSGAAGSLPERRRARLRSVSKLKAARAASYAAVMGPLRQGSSKRGCEDQFAANWSSLRFVVACYPVMTLDAPTAARTLFISMM